MPTTACRPVPTAILIPLTLLAIFTNAHATGHEAISPLFPKPPSLRAGVTFWKRIFTDFGVGDFVLHDRDNLDIIYDVVQVTGITNERRAAEMATADVERLGSEPAARIEML